MDIRLAEPPDALAVAKVHIRSWQVAYRSLLPDEYLSQLRPEDRAQRYDFASDDCNAPKTIVAVESDALLGFATTSPSRDADLPNDGELCALYVDPDHWGHGVGKLLIAEARRRLADQGFANAFLWMLTGNQRADRFYRGDNWLPDGSFRSDSVWGIALDEIRYQRRLAESPQAATR